MQTPDRQPAERLQCVLCAPITAVYSSMRESPSTDAQDFKFRNKVGLDVAIEALRDALREKKATVNEIYRYAKVCRVSSVIRPYMEAL